MGHEWTKLVNLFVESAQTITKPVDREPGNGPNHLAQKVDDRCYIVEYRAQ